MKEIVKGESEPNTGIALLLSVPGLWRQRDQLPQAPFSLSSWQWMPVPSNLEPKQPFFPFSCFGQVISSQQPEKQLIQKACCRPRKSGWKADLKKLFPLRNIQVCGASSSFTLSWVVLGRRQQAGTGEVGFLLRLWAERNTASQSLTPSPFPDPRHPCAPFFISVYLLRDPDSDKKAHFLPVCRTIAREACS